MSKAAELAALIGSQTALSNRNLIINGAMQVDQRYAGTGPNVITGGAYNVDRFGMYYDGNAYTTQQSTTAPDGFRNSLLLTVTGTSTPNYSFFGQRIEGLNSAQLGFGTSWAKTITVSFWVRSSVAGIYSIAITNGAGDRAYAVQYTINSANTWEYKTATISGDTTGTWLTNNANGLYLRFNMGSPSGRLISAGSWQAVNADGATGSTGADSWATSSGATFYITGIQLELGEQATPFEHRSYGDELARCQRYLQLVGKNAYFAGNGVGTTSINFGVPVIVSMRTTPSVPNTGYTFHRTGNANSGTNAVTLVAYDTDAGAMRLRANFGSGITDEQIYNLSVATADLQLDAEL